jgi:uncharacterized protein (TIGR00369 family)
MTPETFAAPINEWASGTMIAAHGTRFVSAGGGRALARLDFKPELTQLTGLFHAGAIIALADETATAAAMWETNPTGEFRPELFPLTLQMSVNLIKNANRGTLVAEAELAKFVATLLAPAPPAVTAPADRPGR